MTAPFSKRLGKVPQKINWGLEEIPFATQNRLWNAIDMVFTELRKNARLSEGRRKLDKFAGNMWHDFFGRTIDTIPHDYDERGLAIRNWFFEERLPWYRIYDFIEYLQAQIEPALGIRFSTAVNNVLSMDGIPYRLVGGQITPLTNEQEISAVEYALTESGPEATHLRRAVELMSDRQNPDFRNSIKESISAVEATCIRLTGLENATLGQAIKELEKRGAMHPALREAFSKLYGYASSSEGIRHALMEKSSLTEADARFMLVVCSAFINYARAQ